MDTYTLIVLGFAGIIAVVIAVGALLGHKPQIGAGDPDRESIADQKFRSDGASDSFFNRMD